MARYQRNANITIDVPDHVTIENVTAPARTRGARKPLPQGPIPIAVAAPPVDEDPIVGAMLRQDLVLVDSFNLIPIAPAVVRAAPIPSRLTIEVEENEDSVILFEQDGVYSWRYGESARTVVAQPARRGPIRVRPKRRVSFDLSVEPAPTAEARRKRGPAADFIIGKVRTYIFRFVAHIAVDSVIGFLERKKRTGLVNINVDDPTMWAPIERLDEMDLPSDRPAHILLFIHGTFSSTVGSYGAIGVSEWGRAFLSRSRANYDAIIGYDHRTLSRDPLQNAEDLLGRLECNKAPSLLIDAVAYSRGALVLRSMIEYLLPSASVQARVRRAVFVGGTNTGTQFAVRENWIRLIDLTTNLVSVGCRVLAAFAPTALAATIARESIDTLGALVKCLTTEVLSEEAVPGLAAMVPTGRFITEINKTQPGQPVAAESLYYAISSEFDVGGIFEGKGAKEFPAQLAQWAADVVVDAAMREPNDLVVNTASMIAIDAAAGLFIKDRLHFDRNPHVYHTIYFTREEVIRTMARWLHLEPTVAGTSATAEVNAGADDRIVLVEADEPLGTALVAIDNAAPTFVIAKRTTASGETMLYAYRSEELIALGQQLGQRGRSQPLEVAVQGTPLAMHESTRSIATTPDAIAGIGKTTGLTGERLILTDGVVPRAVLERGESMASNLDLAEVSNREARLVLEKSIKSPKLPIKTWRTRSGRDLEMLRRTRSIDISEDKQQTPPRSGSLFLAADMPQCVPVGSSVSLSVVVCQDEIDFQSSPTQASAKATVSLDRTVLVQVIPKQNVIVAGDDRATIDPNEARTELVFDIKGTVPGPAEVWVLLRQGAVACATIKLRPEVVTGPLHRSDVRVWNAAEAAPVELDGCVYPILQIFELKEGKALKYRFILQPTPNEFVTGDSKEIRSPREKYVAKIYKNIEDKWTSAKHDLDAFHEELRTYGGVLLDELVPLSVHDALWQVRDTLKAIQVVAEEPFIPWELLHLKPAANSKGQPAPLPDKCYFLAQMGLVRWLHNRGPAPLCITIRKGHSYYVIPTYPHPDYELPEAQAEIPHLQSAFGAQEVVPEVNEIRNLLRTPGKVHHFHFSGHGEADAESAVDAQLLLSLTAEKNLLVPRYLKADLVAEHGRLLGEHGAKAVVVLNACQVGRAGWRLSSIGGFAESFLRAGAGIFVGTLWSVGDEPAHSFSEAFYKELISGKTLAEATTAGRDAARAAKEATWLAYVVYGNPCARLTVDK